MGRECVYSCSTCGRLQSATQCDDCYQREVGTEMALDAERSAHLETRKELEAVKRERDEARRGGWNYAAYAERLLVERDKARALADNYANGEVITKGIARLVDEQCARAYAARDEARAALRDVAERQREACRKAAALAPNCEVHEHGPCEWDAACDAIAGLVGSTPLVTK